MQDAHAHSRLGRISGLARIDQTVWAANPAAAAVAWRPAGVLISAAILLLCSGCVVPQPRGEGKLERIVEPTTRRGYWLYLPKDYIQADEPARSARRWPIVVTFHGMKPFDPALFQAKEWEQEADRYGYIVIAPELNAFVALVGEFPVRTINPAFKSDELATLAILDHVFETTHADPSNVLATSWSSGGYLAHYMLNRHPERFTCLAVRQSNFSGNVLDPAATARSLYHPVLVLSTQLDVEICRAESREAVKWYESHGYKNLAWVHIARLGHERTPDMAADFFARVCGAQPDRPPKMLMARQALDGNPRGLALLSGKLEQLQQASESGRALVVAQEPLVRPPTQPRPVLVARTGASADTPPAAPEPPSAPPTPQRSPPPTNAASPHPLLAVRVSTTIDFEPLSLSYSADCPSDWQRTAAFAWTLNGESIGDGVNGQRTITQPGDYTLAVRVVTRDGTEYHAARQIRVLKGLAARAPASP